MSKFFGLDSPMWNFFNRLADLVIVNFCFLLCCIPIVTIGAAWTALYYTVIKMKRHEEGPITRMYFHAFRENLKQATFMWVADVLLFALIGLDLVLVGALQSGARSVLHMTILMIGLVFIITIMYTFPLLAQFDNTIINTYKNAFIMSLRHIGYTVLLAIVTLAPVLLVFTNTSTIPAILMIYLIIGFGVSAFVNTGLYLKIFENYMPE
ncbi:MAG: DUF624 domain-containing protein [bacterium]|nr:DUF624 domain-containing protein [bacterium]